MEAGEEAEEEVARAIMDLGGAAVVSEAIRAEVEDELEVEEEGMEGRLAVVNKLTRSFPTPKARIPRLQRSKMHCT
ncbi:hypothetical protein FOMG_18916 [Fusarium oxysporum f. sp. melonis 26406]|uniref:Uncharacterized protein n=1 Tax=Fusarium oxysporum f. sp. melonis 26406 TaxID=1089452 RepID=W9YYV7_FUSOX|nr:hypothetical protein FOMG_18916 [Fusarium oxysporum f. sp. melonis 26406]